MSGTDNMLEAHHSEAVMDLSSEMNRAGMELETEEERLREMKYQNYKARVMRVP